MSRAVAVMRMHLTDQVTLLLLPIAIMVTSFAINIVVWNLVPVNGRSTGGAASLYVFVLIAAMYAVIRGLPFALGMGSTRRSFTSGTWLTGLALGLGFGTMLLLLQVVERATGGWWLRGHFFWFTWFARDSWPVTWLLLVVSILATFGVGAAVAALWSRFQIWALIVGGPLALVVAGAVLILVVGQDWWSQIGAWFGGLTPLSLTGWCGVLVVACLAATWTTLRRVRA